MGIIIMRPNNFRVHIFFLCYNGVIRQKTTQHNANTTVSRSQTVGLILDQLAAHRGIRVRGSRTCVFLILLNT